MNTDRLEEAIQERKKQAADREIYDKGYAVAKHLGKPFSDKPSGHKYIDDTLQIALGCSSYSNSEVEIRHNSAIVFRGDLNRNCEEEQLVLAYVPGEWEMHLNRMNQQAKIAERKKWEQAVADDMAQKKKDFGL